MLTDTFLQVALLGAEWVMWLLVITSFLSVALIIERALYFGSHRLKPDFADDLQALLERGMLKEAKDFVDGARAPECQVIAAGLQHMARGPQATAEAMLSAKAQVRPEMERYLGVLGTIGSNAPFVGLLGTVLGIIKASHDMQLAEAAEAASSSAMAGVFEALVATAVGLFVAIPAVIAFNFYQRTVKTRVAQIDSVAHLLLALAKPINASSAAAVPSSAAPATPVPPPPPLPSTKTASAGVKRTQVT